MPVLPAGRPQCGRVSRFLLIQTLTMVTNTPPSEAQAWLMPSHFSRWCLSSNTSASQVMAATNSTHTPMKVVQRKKMKTGSEVAKAAQNGEKE